MLYKLYKFSLNWSRIYWFCYHSLRPMKALIIFNSNPFPTNCGRCIFKKTGYSPRRIYKPKWSLEVSYEGRQYDNFFLAFVNVSFISQKGGNRFMVSRAYFHLKWISDSQEVICLRSQGHRQFLGGWHMCENHTAIRHHVGQNPLDLDWMFYFSSKVHLCHVGTVKCWWVGLGKGSLLSHQLALGHFDA